jgi:predicted RNA-binding protein with PIN domain
MTILVDGHNLIGQMAGLHLDDPDDEERLMIRLRAYRARTGKPIVVYFDAGMAYQSPAGRSNGGVIIRWAGTGRHADDLIARDVGRHPNPRELTVVTSDRALQTRVRLGGARIMDAAAFAVELNRPAGTRRKSKAHRRSLSGRRGTDRDSQHLTEAEVRTWLAIMGRPHEQ